MATSIGWRRAVQAEQLAEQRQNEAEQTTDELWEVAQLQFQLLAGARGNKNIKLAEVIEDWSQKLPATSLNDRTAAMLHAAIGASFYGLGLNDRALQEYKRANELLGDNAAAMPRISRIVRTGQARVLLGIGRNAQAEPLLRDALEEMHEAGDGGLDC